jgi:hypothetical protein
VCHHGYGFLSMLSECPHENTILSRDVTPYSVLEVYDILKERVVSIIGMD